MRIISGSAKGRRLFSPSSGNTRLRPTADRVKEALFSIIDRRIMGSTVLDLFSGSGSLGCEALSRGAQQVVFIENDPQALKLIKKNLSLIPVSANKFRIIKQDLRRGLSKHIFTLHTHVLFDLVLADPPYNQGLSQTALDFLDGSTILAPNVLIIIEEHKGVVLNNRPLKALQAIDSRVYGDTALHRYQRRQPHNTQ